jgi:hypothetical protein
MSRFSRQTLPDLLAFAEANPDDALAVIRELARRYQARQERKAERAGGTGRSPSIT